MGSRVSRLQKAVEEDSPHVVRKMVDQGIPTDTEFEVSGCATENKFKNKRVKVNALHLASRFGHAKTLKLLVDLGADLDTKSSVGDTPLMLAARYNHLRCVYILMSAGANVNEVNQANKTAEDIAIEHENYNVESALIGEDEAIDIEAEERAHLASIGVFSISSNDMRTFFSSGFV